MTVLIKKEPLEAVRCRNACPAGVDVPRFIRLAEKGRFDEALAVIHERNPFASVTGHTCLVFCEADCRRSEVDASVGINALERFVSERTRLALPKKGRHPKSSGKRVAVVGSGPTGLTAAYYLAGFAGHSVTVFEELPEPGGMMRYGIPRYRLPEEALTFDIDYIKSVGVSIKTGTRVETPDDLLTDGFDAVLWATGAGQGRRLPIPGADSDGVWIGLTLLKEASMGRDVKVGRRVAVLGGGNVAFDCARTALRLGAAEVHIVSRKQQGSMVASKDEIEEAKDEGVIIHPSQTATKIIVEHGHIAGVECLDVRTFRFDNQGIAHIDSIKGSEHILPADTVIFAVGQLPEMEPIKVTGIGVTSQGTLEVDSLTLATGKEGVFAAGDSTTGTASVIEAVAAGRNAAIAIDRYLGGEEISKDAITSREEAATWYGFDQSILEITRVSMPVLPAKERIHNFAEVKLGLSEDMAMRESARCLRCDQSVPVEIDVEKCSNCYTCQLVCSLVYQGLCSPEKARIILSPKEINYTSECIAGCSLCIQYCPQDAIAIKQ